MEHIERTGLGSKQVYERYDTAEAQTIFERLNEQWEEMYAEEADPANHAVPIPEEFLAGRKAYIFHMFYRVLALHDAEVEKIKATKERMEGGWR
jgi:hypothetical protein